MKKRGISLIVLVVTIIVIIILAGAVILSLTNNNPIEEANEATFKSELKSLDEQVLLSITKGYITDNNIMSKKITSSDELYKYIPQLKGSKYDGKVYITEGRLTINASKFTKEQVQWAIEAQIKVGDLPIVKTVELTSTETTITAKVTMDSTSGIVGYMYKITGVGIAVEEWITKPESTHTFENLKVGTEYIIEVKAKTNELESISHMNQITTKGVNELVSLVPNTTEWTKNNVIVTISHANIPSGYELQYKIGSGNWIKYTNIVTVDTNVAVYCRLYNTVLDDAIGENSYNVTKIDKTNPTAITNITEITKTSNSITVQAVGSTDNQSGIIGYEYSINGGLYSSAITGNKQFTSLTQNTQYAIKARAKDNAGNYSSEKSINITTVSTIYTTNKSESKYKLPYMPTDFNYVEGTYETGLVIKDNNNGNEFVWIPVADFSKFSRVEYNRGESVAQCTEDKVQPELAAIYTSVEKYGGYYIARYEAGLPNTTSPATSNHNTVCDGTIKPVSKPGVSPWNYIPWGANNNIANPGNGAVTVARSMYKTNADIQSTLIYGVQWDAALEFIKKYGIKDITYQTDSTNKGNYSPNPLKVTGASTAYKLNNIYDMAGNDWEWTMEAYSTYGVYRGGGYNGDSASAPAGYRCGNVASNSYDGVGFRPALYIK